MEDAHVTARGGSVRARGRFVVRTETGFTLIELLVVLIMVAILMAVALPAVNKTRRNTDGASNAMAAGMIWHAIADYRYDNQGRLPDPKDLVNESTASVPGAGGFKDPLSNKPYIKNWPNNSQGKRIEVVADASTSPTPPNGAAPAGQAGKVVYNWTASPTASDQRYVGWIVAYSSSGTMVYRRSITSDTTRGPIG